VKPLVGIAVVALFALTACTPEPPSDARVDYLALVGPPEGVEVPSSIDGEWISAEPSELPGLDESTLVLDNGQWTWNGCYANTGDFELTERGRVLVFPDPTGMSLTYEACIDSHLSVWFGSAVSVGVVGGELVFFDAYDKVLGTARKA